MKLTEMQGTVYRTDSRAKIHLDPNCQYLRNRDDYNEVDSVTLPEGHYELCSWCKSYFEAWDDGVSLDNAQTECRRCGVRGVQYLICEDCQQQVTLGR